MYDTAVQQNQLQQHHQASFQQYAAAEDEKFWRAHPEFHGGLTGDRALAKLAEATLAEIVERTGYTREQVWESYNTDPTTRSFAVQEAALALGRQRLARESMKNGRARTKVLHVQKPGAARDVARHGEAEAAGRKFNQTATARDAGKFLAALRRSAR